MSNPALESTIHEILDLKRMREELDATITALEDSIKAIMGDKEILTAAHTRSAGRPSRHPAWTPRH